MSQQPQIKPNTANRASTNVQPSSGRWNEIELTAIRRLAARNATEADFERLLEVADKHQLNPLAGEIRLLKSKLDAPEKSAKLFVSHQGYIALAHATGLLDGLESGPVYSGEGELIGAKASCWRNDMRHAFTVQLALAEYRKVFPGSLWAVIPATLLCEVAECLAITRAFNLTGFYPLSELGLPQAEERLNKNNGAEQQWHDNGNSGSNNSQRQQSGRTGNSNIENSNLQKPEVTPTTLVDRAAIERNTVLVALPIIPAKTEITKAFVPPPPIPTPLHTETELDTTTTQDSTGYGGNRPTLPKISRNPNRQQQGLIELALFELQQTRPSREGGGIELGQLAPISREYLESRVKEVTGGWTLEQLAEEIGYSTLTDALTAHFANYTEYKRQNKHYSLALAFFRAWWLVRSWEEQAVAKSATSFAAKDKKVAS